MSRFRSKSKSGQTRDPSAGRGGVDHHPNAVAAMASNASSGPPAAPAKGFHMWRKKEVIKCTKGDTYLYILSVRTQNALQIRPPSSSSSNDDRTCRCRELMASQHIQQDIVSIKTYLHRLRRILQDAETANVVANSANNVIAQPYNYTLHVR